MRRRRLTPAFMLAADEARARAEARDARVGGELPQPGRVGLAVVEHDRRARQQPADQEVPHHPAGRGEPEEAVARPAVAVQVRLLQVLQQDAAVALDDRLRQPRRAGRVEHPQRMVERHRLEGELGRLGQQIVPARRHQHGVLERRDGRLDFAHPRPAVEVASAVPVALNGDQHLGLDLPEAVDHAWACRTRARSSTRSRRCSRRRGTPRPSPARSACRPTTRSPRPTPSRRRPAAQRATWSRSSSQESSASGADSDALTIAVSPARAIPSRYSA